MARKLAVLVINLVANLEGASLQGSQVLPHIQESLTKFRNHKSEIHESKSVARSQKIRGNQEAGLPHNQESQRVFNNCKDGHR